MTSSKHGLFRRIAPVTIFASHFLFDSEEYLPTIFLLTRTHSQLQLHEIGPIFGFKQSRVSVSVELTAKQRCWVVADMNMWFSLYIRAALRAKLFTF